MLILTRRPGESIQIDNPRDDDCAQLAMSAGEPITVTVLGVKGTQVRVGIAAPADVTILREELVPESA